MKSITFQLRLALMLGSLGVLIPYIILGITFEYPAVLRLPAGELLEAYYLQMAEGPWLTMTWAFFALGGLPLLWGYYLLQSWYAGGRGKLITGIGMTGLIAQLIGLMRWVLVVPGLASAHHQWLGDEHKTFVLEQLFILQHQWGGVLVGEFVGQLLTIIWWVGSSMELYKNQRIPQWAMSVSLAGAFIYLLAEAELVHTVIPNMPFWEPAGFIGSTIWLFYLIYLAFKLKQRNQTLLHLASDEEIHQNLPSMAAS